MINVLHNIWWGLLAMLISLFFLCAFAKYAYGEFDSENKEH